ncbi:hypothetical protein GCM10009554_27300 [Kribbella koreensis]|uniref:J domain-containing protein n=1 Tax=Kribbella koreensis TaxID=57909 RepID=A0ABP4AN94_9ACTN
MTTAREPDPYLVLGVTVEASDHDLDHAFRGLVRRLHPDTRTPPAPNTRADTDLDADLTVDADADRRLQELLTAYATLRNPISRAAHDRTRTRPAPHRAAASATTPMTTPPARVHAVQQPSTPPTAIRVGPALRVGPVRWEPSASQGPRSR